MDKNIFYKLLGKEEPGLLERNKELIKENEYLKKTLAIQQGANKSIADRCISLENKLELLEKDAEQYIEVEVQRKLMELEDQYKDQMNHRWYGIGRQDAYREMGIWNIEAHKRGNVLVMDRKGDVVELIQDLEDVQEEMDSKVAAYLEDSITIDDLEELGA